MPDLSEYRRRRDPRRTPEPVPEDGPLPAGENNVFVVQEHHARRLHWDVRFERDGVLVSWAVPKGLPPEPGVVRLAVHTEDHPLEYARFAGEIPHGEYGGGRVTIWDRGHYETEKWTGREIQVVLHGQRVEGRYVFFRTGSDNDWMVRRRDPPQSPDWAPLPEQIAPMAPVPGRLPPAEEDDQWSYEADWAGLRALGAVAGGRLRLLDADGEEITGQYPELRGLGELLGSTEALLDGEVVAFEDGRPSRERLAERSRPDLGTSAARRLAAEIPVLYVLFDLLHKDGRSLLDLPFERRRAELEGLGIEGRHWQISPASPGAGPDILRTGAEHGLAGAVAKRLDSPYRPGQRSPDWIQVSGVRVRDVVIGGWRPSAEDEQVVDALLVGVPGEPGPRFVGAVRTGLTDAQRAELGRRLGRLHRATAPFAERLPAGQYDDVRWVTPKLVGEVVFHGWTKDGRLSRPSWRRWRKDRKPEDVADEQ